MAIGAADLCRAASQQHPRVQNQPPGDIDSWHRVGALLGNEGRFPTVLVLVDLEG